MVCWNVYTARVDDRTQSSRLSTSGQLLSAEPFVREFSKQAKSVKKEIKKGIRNFPEPKKALEVTKTQKWIPIIIGQPEMHMQV